jgi:hypothetical protein
MECEIDQRIISLSPCLERERFERFADLLHRKAELAFVARRAAMNRRYAIKTAGEEQTCAALAAVASAGRWDDADIAAWNGEMERYRAAPAGQRAAAGLSPAEAEYCAENDVGERYFADSKRRLVMECEARRWMTREFAQTLAGPRAREMAAVYDFVQRAGWIP